MSCKIPDDVEAWLQEIEFGEYQTNRYNKALAAHIRKTFAEEDLTFEQKRYEKYLSLEKYFPFRLLPWEKMIIALWLCTYDRNGFPRWDTLYNETGRGTGKDGLISFVGFCVLSPYNPAKEYDVDICATNEDQAMRPVKDLSNIIERSQERKKLERFYHRTVERVSGRENGGVMQGRTGNPGGKDGMRSGMVILNEVHAYQNYDMINVFQTGLGKKIDSRKGIFTSNGDVEDGPKDDYRGRADRILFEGEADDGFLPYVNCLDDAEEVKNRENWNKANPSLRFMPQLQHQIETEYQEWLKDPENHTAFMTKRMGVRKGKPEIAVTSYENLLATKTPLPDMTGWSCIASIDYAELDDWAAVNLHFKYGEERFDINHAWICTQGRYIDRIRPNWQKWVEMGFLTPVDRQAIHPEMIAEYLFDAGQRYKIISLAMDSFRWPLLRNALEAIGFHAEEKDRVKLVRPSDIMRIEPVIQDCFNRHLFRWGDNPMLRWATNNTKRVRASKKIGSDTGNYYYAKIEYRSRKTDPFMALVHGMTLEERLDREAGPDVPIFGAFEL